MRLVTYAGAGGPRLGRVAGDRVEDLTAALSVPDVGALLAGPGLEAAAAAAGDDAGALDDLTLLAPVIAPRRILCVGVNYAKHREEMGREAFPYPTLFVRFPSSVVGHRQPILRPRASERYDFEGELAVIVGRGGRHVAEADAYRHVAGYACFDDGTARDYQRHTSQFTPGKNFDGSGAFGPWMITRDEVPDPHALSLETRVNGEVMQSASTGDMIFRIPALIAYITTFTALEPGDVIATGTPSGVGHKRQPPRYLSAGDRLEVEIEGVGTLESPVEDEA